MLTDSAAREKKWKGGGGWGEGVNRGGWKGYFHGKRR